MLKLAVVTEGIRAGLKHRFWQSLDHRNVLCAGHMLGLCQENSQ